MWLLELVRSIALGAGALLALLIIALLVDWYTKTPLSLAERQKWLRQGLRVAEETLLITSVPLEDEGHPARSKTRAKLVADEMNRYYRLHRVRLSVRVNEIALLYAERANGNASVNT